LLLEVLSELGLLGLLVVVLPFLAFPRPRFDAASRWGRQGVVVLALVTFWLVNVQLSGDVVDSRYLWFALVLFEIASRASREDAAPPFGQPGAGDVRLGGLAA
jgi:hypothetical protein